MIARSHWFWRRLLAALPLAAAALAVVTLASPAHAESLQRILEDDRYRFCHEENYPLYEDEHAWCELVGERSDRCPALPAACDNVPEGVPLAAGDGRSGDGPAAEEKRRQPPTGDGRSRRPERKEIQVNSPLAGIARFLFFALIAFGIGYIIWLIVKNRLKGKGDKPEEDDDDIADFEPSEEQLPAAARVVETDVDRLLRLAQEAAARGDYEKGLEHAYAAALRRLEGDGLIDMHSSTTNGDYVRGLRRSHPDKAQALRGIVRDVEQVQFGNRAADAPLFQSLFAQVLPFVGRAVAIALLILAGGMISGCDEDPAQRDQSRRDEIFAQGKGSTSPTGARAVVTFLNQGAVETDYRLADLASLDETTGVLVVMPEGGPDDDNWDPVVAWVKRGGTLVLAGVEADHDDLPFRMGPALSSDPQLHGDWEFAGRFSGLDIRVPPSASVSVAPESGVMATPMLVRDDPNAADVSLYAVHTQLGRGEVIALADAWLMTNIAMTVGDNGEALARMLRYHGKVEIADAWTGAGAANPIESIHEAKLTPIVLQIMALLLLFILWRGIHFGTPRDPDDQKRRSFADHVRALGTTYARASASGHALGAYAHYALERIRERIPRGRQRDIGELADELSARTGKPAGEIERVLSEAQAASNATAPSTMRPQSQRGEMAAYDPSASNSSHHLSLMATLAQLLSAVGRGRRGS